jgi:hypothetical protein
MQGCYCPGNALLAQAGIAERQELVFSLILA